MQPWPMFSQLTSLALSDEKQPQAAREMILCLKKSDAMLAYLLAYLLFRNSKLGKEPEYHIIQP